MITTSMVDELLAGVRGQALREGTRYAREARVADLAGSADSVTTVVRGSTGDFEVELWTEDGVLEHHCGCPSWRDPCKHQVAAALVLRQHLAGTNGNGARAASGRGARPPAIDASRLTDTPPPEPAVARARALEERAAAARREKLVVRPAEPPYLSVTSPSGFSYRVRLRGGPDGPHGCDCPDFEANRLHTCKHVERVRRHLRSARLPREHGAAAGRARIYLHLGEVVEPRLIGQPVGRGSAAVRAAFGDAGRPVVVVPQAEEELRDWLAGFGGWTEPEALAWLDGRIERRPRLPASDFESIVGPLPLEPYDYQWKGAAFLAATGRALLADEMGLGKTVQAIMAAAALRRAERPVTHVTVVCPASLRGNWQDEIRRWLGEEAVALEGPVPERARVIASRPQWLVTHYEQVLRDHPHHRANPPDLLIIDEAQRAKGIQTRTARVLKAIESRHVFALTGTPLENRLEEAYAIAQLVDQRLLPPLWQVDRDHFVRDDRGRRVVLYRNLDALRSRLAPAFLRRRKEDVAVQLPERLRSVSLLAMHPAVIDTYEDVMAQVARIATKRVILPADLERMQRLLVIARRCCNGPHMLGREVRDREVPKLDELEHSLRDLCLGEGRKAVVFSEWTDMTDRVASLCDRLCLPSVHLHGGVPVARRPGLIRSFTEGQGPAVFISTDAGGVGLNLQAADVVVNLDLPWNPARLEQRIARAHRIGSKTTVQVLLLVTGQSLEERILQLHDTKRNVLDNIWSKDGDDTIAAPGGSGAFREMVQALLATRGPARAQSRTAVAPEPDEHDEGPRDELRVGNPTPTEAAGRVDAQAAPPEPRAPLADLAASPVGPCQTERSSGAATGDAPTDAANPATSGIAAPSAPHRPDGGSSPATAVNTVDPSVLASAMAGLAPALPPSHRKSLATVLRALAEALDG
ncbi:MAG: SWIM zinc finger family protein [Deltaproteobacteria bacterium]|nr:SWIM zinc finger family protein [Deltaproteobacteria bacterium]